MRRGGNQRGGVGGQSTFTADARGRGQEDVVLLLGLGRGQVGIQISLYVGSCGESSERSSMAIFLYNFLALTYTNASHLDSQWVGS